MNPITSKSLIECMQDAVLIFDNENHLLEFNDLAGALLELNADSIGAYAYEIFSPFEEYRELGDLSVQEANVKERQLKNNRYSLNISAIRDSLGMIVAKIVTLQESIECQDVVSRLKDEIEIHRELELKLRKLIHAVEQMANSVVITDKDGIIEYVNPWTIGLTGYSEDELINQNSNILQSGLTPSKTFDELWDTLNMGLEWRGTFINKKKNSEIYWEYCIISPIRDPQGNTTHYVAIKEDITERTKMEEELHKLATTDGLTGVKNRREITRLINEELKRADRSGHSTSVIMLDVDLFKQVNDGLGHAAGDRVIAQIANTLEKSLRQTDSIGRYGGDEFIILLPETSYSQAKKLAEKLRSSIEEKGIDFNNQTIHVTSSMGVGNIDGNGVKRNAFLPDFEVIMSLADRGLYEAKEAGRNCVR